MPKEKNNTSKYMVLVKAEGPIFVKDHEFFISQGGDREDWGKSWQPIKASSIEDARSKAERLRPKPDAYLEGMMAGRPLNEPEPGSEGDVDTFKARHMTSIHDKDCAPIEYSVDTCPERDVILRRHSIPTLLSDELSPEVALQLGKKLIETANAVLARKKGKDKRTYNDKIRDAWRAVSERNGGQGASASEVTEEMFRKGELAALDTVIDIADLMKGIRVP